MTHVVQHEPVALRAARSQRCDEILAGNLSSLRHAASLDLHNLQLGDTVMSVVLSRIAGVSGLSALHLGFNVLRADAMRALAASPLSVRLVELDLTGNPLGDAGIAALFGGAFPHLAVLGLSWCSLGDGALGVIAEATTFPALRELSLRRNAFTDEGARALASAVTLRQTLTSLNLDYNDTITRRGMKALREAYGGSLVE